MNNYQKLWISTDGLMDTPMGKAIRDCQKRYDEHVTQTFLTHLECEDAVKQYITNDIITTKELIDKLRERCKEKNEMKTNDIIWRVNDVSVASDNIGFIPRLDIKAKLVGIPKRNIGGFDRSTIYTELQRILDSDSPMPKIEKVIFNKPATIILWTDGTKTVVKRQKGDRWDPEKGFTMAYLKKLLGNDNSFNKEVKKWVREDTSNET